MTLSNQHLRTLCAQHLVPELYQFTRCARLLPGLDSASLDDVRRQAVVDSFLVHGRNLIDFFFGKRLLNRKNRKGGKTIKTKSDGGKKNKAVYVEDYIDSFDGRVKLREVRTLRKRLERGLAPVSLQRLKAGRTDWTRQARKVALLVSPVLYQMIWSADPKLIDPETRTKLQEMYVGLSEVRQLTEVAQPYVSRGRVHYHEPIYTSSKRGNDQDNDI